MTEEEFAEIRRVDVESLEVRGSALRDQTDRTLIYGYTCDRDTFHLYLKDGKISRVVYHSHPAVLRESQDHGLSVADCLPNKRAYPARCDYEFCRLIKRLGGYISFTQFEEIDPPEEWAPYHGLVANG